MDIFLGWGPNWDIRRYYFVKPISLWYNLIAVLQPMPQSHYNHVTIIRQSTIIIGTPTVPQ